MGYDFLDKKKVVHLQWKFKKRGDTKLSPRFLSYGRSNGKGLCIIRTIA